MTTSFSQLRNSAISFATSTTGLDKDNAANKCFISASTSKLTFSGAGGADVALTGLATCSEDKDAANKAYVDSVAQGLNVKTSCNAATTAVLSEATANLSENTITIANGKHGFSTGEGFVVDEYTLGAEDFVLIKDGVGESNPKYANGVYQVGAIGGASLTLTRSDNMNETDEVSGAFTFITDGTANAHQGFVVGKPDRGDTFTLGQGDIDFFQFSGAGALTAGTGLTKNGNTINLNATHTSVTTITHVDLKIQSAADTNVIELEDSEDDLKISTADKKIKIHAAGSGTNAVDIDATAGGVTIDAGEGISLDAAEASNFTTTSGALTLSGAGGVTMTTADNNDITIDPNGSGNLTLGSTDNATTALAGKAVTIDAAEGISLDADAASNFTTSQGALTLHGAGGINIGTTANVAVDFNASTFDLDASGALTMDASDTSNFTVSGSESGNKKNLTLSVTGNGAGKLIMSSAGSEANAIYLNASEGGIDVDAAEGVTVDAGAGISLDAAAASNFTTSQGTLTLSGAEGVTMTTAANKDITIDPNGTGNLTLGSAENATTALAGNAVDIDAASGVLSLDGAGGINIGKGTTESVAVDFDASTFDLDASGALTIDSATSISIGTAQDKPIDINASTLTMDASDTSNLTVTSAENDPKNLTLAVVGGGAQQLIMSSAGTGANAVDINATAGGVTIDANAGISLDADDDSNFTVDASGKTLTLSSAGEGTSKVLVSSAGTGDDAVNIVATTGGITLSTDTGEKNMVFNCGTSAARGCFEVNAHNFTVSEDGVTTISLTCSSDAVLKKNIETINNPLETIKNLRGVNWDWKSTNTKSSGVIAQELLEHMPWAVHGSEGTYSVNYMALTGYFIEAIKSLNEKINKLENN